MLPGLLYSELVYDVQRNIILEIIICLSPPSAAALLLRHALTMESLLQQATLLSILPVTHLPLHIIMLILLFECFIYLTIALWILDHRIIIIQFFRILDYMCNCLKCCMRNFSFERSNTPSQLYDTPKDTTNMNGINITTTKSIISVSNLCKTYKQTEVLNNINCRLNQGTN